MAHGFGNSYDVGVETQLLVDDHLIAERAGLERRMHRPEKHPDNPVMEPTGVFERDYKFHYTWDNGSVIRDPEDGAFRAYWAQAQKHGLYAYSGDGIRWEKPELGLVEYGGNKRNNILVADTHPVSVAHNPMAGEAPYVMFGNGRHKLQTSHDGLHWRERESDVKWAGDSGACVHDPFTGRHIAFQKRRYPIGKEVINPLTAEPWDIPIRVLGVTISDDGVHWSPWREVLRPDETDHASVAERYPAIFVEGFRQPWKMKETFRPAHEYARRTRFLDRLTAPPQAGFHHMDYMNLIVIPYHGLYLGLLQVLNSTAQVIDFGAKGEPRPDSPGQDGTMDVQLVCSRDLLHWERLGDREPFLPLGEVGAWDQSMLMPFTSNGIVRDGKHWLYYGGSFHSHRPRSVWDMPGDYPEERQALGLATLRRDGFVSLRAGPEGGSLIMRPLGFPGGRLTLNFATGESGSVAVELRDEAGQPLPGYALEQCDPIYGDALDFVVSWSGEADLSGLADRPVRLYFELRDAALYAFRFATD